MNAGRALGHGPVPSVFAAKTRIVPGRSLELPGSIPNGTKGGRFATHLLIVMEPQHSRVDFVSFGGNDPLHGTPGIGVLPQHLAL
jgi:hypothetical protein